MGNWRQKCSINKDALGGSLKKDALTLWGLSPLKEPPRRS